LKIILAISLILLLVSVMASVYGYRKMINCYRELRVMRLELDSEEKFAAENLKLNDEKTQTPRVVLLGDSRVSLWEPLPDSQNYHLVNRGVSGEVTTQMLKRLDKDVVRLKPAVVVLQAGINDLNTIGVLPGRKDDIVNLCKDNLREIIDELVERGIYVVVLTVFSPGKASLLREPVWSDEIYTAVSSVNEMLKAMHDSHLTVVDCDGFLSVGQRIKPEYAEDEFHLKSRAYEVINEHVKPILESLTKKQ